MNSRLPLFFAALLGLLASAAPAASGERADAWDGCTEYPSFQGQPRHWICVAPRDASCPIYTKEEHGVKRCLVQTTTTAGWPACVPTSGGMDYPSYLCVDPRDPLCAVYTLTTTDWGVQKRCYGVLKP